MNHLYPDFLKDYSQFQMAITHWNKLFDDNVPDSRKWEDICGYFSVDGTSLRMANPIFSRRRLLRSVTIDQYQPKSESISVGYYMHRHQLEDDELEGLRIQCQMSDEAVLLIGALFRLWCSTKIDRAGMESFLESLDPYPLEEWATLIDRQAAKEAPVDNA